MEQILERKASPRIDWRTIRIYEEDGTQITNPDTLQGIAEAQDIIAEWEARMDRYEREGVFDGWEEDEDIDGSEEDGGKQEG